MDSSTDSAAKAADAAAAPAPSDAAHDDVIGVLEQGRKRFLALVEQVRPELHRYCARMTGSVADGEDVVQETLARAYYELSQLKEVPPLRPWLFRIAHNRAIDHWRHESLRQAEPLDAALDLADEPAREPENALARHQAVRAALSCFIQLAPAQRGCVILKDVLDHSIDEIAGELNLSVPAVKAALHRGRATLHLLGAAPPSAPPARDISPAVLRYAKHFNAHDWDTVRALLADDVRLDLVSRRKAAGRRDVGVYFTNYQGARDWRLAPGWLDGREVLGVMRDPQSTRPDYFIELSWRDERVVAIRDFRYVPYIAREAGFVFAI